MDKLSFEKKIDRKKVIILSILFALGFFPMIFNDIFHMFVMNHLGIALLIPYIYGSLIILFWIWADGTIFS